MFWDEAEINVIGGKGGNGGLCFLRTRGNAYGGPDGGDGGNGGDVIFMADEGVNTLDVYVRQKKFEAKNGEAGTRNNRHGKSGDDLILRVPRGTIIYQEKSQGQMSKVQTPLHRGFGGQAGQEDYSLIADLTQRGQVFIVAKGGKGGYGNAHFTSSVRQAPKFAELGEKGEEKAIKLVLKLIADVGIMGLPNAGKSTLLSVISRARPKIADYPFTTIVPSLGVVTIGDKGFVAADIPGLIEGASEGKGLGYDFLRHIERTKVVLHLIDANDENWATSYETINNELKSYSKELAKKAQIIAINKIETIDDKTAQKKLAVLKKKALRKKVFFISAATHQGVNDVLYELVKQLEKIKPASIKEEIKVFDYKSLARDDWDVEKEKNGFHVAGNKIERFASRTNLENYQAVDRLRDIMKKMGILKVLKKQGLKDGDIIRIGEKKFEW